MSIYVSELHRYPLKSGARDSARFDYATVTEQGFFGDRMFMLVHADGPNKGTFISQRDKGHEILAQVKTAFCYPGPMSAPQRAWMFRSPDAERCYVHEANIQELPMDVRVWGSECKGYDAGDHAAEFFSGLLGKPVRLIAYSYDRPRMVDQTYGRADDITSYADGFPILITSNPSLNSLRQHFAAGADIGMDRFRPNIVLDGNLPWEEDTMHHIRIGRPGYDVELEIVKPCSRCVMTTIDQATGKRGDKEPLATLALLRRGEGKTAKEEKSLKGVFFGQNAIPRKLGTISVGDKVEILSTRPLHPALEQNVLKFTG